MNTTDLKFILDREFDLEAIIKVYTFIQTIDGNYEVFSLEDRIIEVKALIWMNRLFELTLDHLDDEYREKANNRIKEIKSLMVNKNVCLN